tara:strand:+ start:3324 stop:4895 length:1572 start_codon:yes stop_codon:yes gene_type:complete
MKKAKASLIIRTFNEEKHIGKLLSEISRQQTTFPYEVIIVDSGSNDRTLDIVSEFETKLIKITPEQFTFGFSLNVGIDAAEGDYCIMTSAHCYPSTVHWIENIVKPFEENDNCAIVYGKQLGIDETKYSEQQIFSRWFPELSNNKTNLPFCNNANCAIRKSDWVTRKFDEELTGLEDLDYARHFHNMKKDIAYRADAGVYHIHDETPKQIMNRYYREALAYKAIYKNETFYFFDFIKFFTMNVFGDYLHAIQDGVFFRNLFDIPLFRFLQFWGTYKAHRFNRPISKEMQKRIFYPRKPRFNKKINKNGSNSNVTFVDITHPMTANMPVWPGSRSFAITELKNHVDDNFMESEVSFNLHTGTHLDAPAHFVKDGGDVTSICLNQLNGSAFVIECLDRKEIDAHFFQNTFIPKGTSRVLLKTLNSTHFAPGKEFNKQFVAITSDAAKWLVENGIEVIGIDGPSIQLFHDKNNLTHEVLLNAKAIIVEGLNLKDVSPGQHKFLCLPLKIQKAEGVPVRATLLQGNF